MGCADIAITTDGDAAPVFWAVNEGASGGPYGNGQTTGENSVALANYAAAL